MISTLDLKGQELVDFLTIVALKQTDTGGYPVMKNHPTYVNTGYIDAEMLKKYFEENKVLKATDYDPREDVIFKN